MFSEYHSMSRTSLFLSDRDFDAEVLICSKELHSILFWYFRWKSRDSECVYDRRPDDGHRLFHLPNHLPGLPPKEKEAAATPPALPAPPSSTALRTEAEEPPRHSPDIHVRRECLTSGGIRQLRSQRSRLCSVTLWRISDDPLLRGSILQRRVCDGFYQTVTFRTEISNFKNVNNNVCLCSILYCLLLWWLFHCPSKKCYEKISWLLNNDGTFQT